MQKVLSEHEQLKKMLEEKDSTRDSLSQQNQDMM